MRLVPFIIAALLVSGMSFFGSHPAYIFIFAAISLSTAAIILALSYAELPYSWQRYNATEPRRTSRATKWIIGASIVFTLSVLTTHWPLRLSYALSKASLNRIAAQVTSGTKVSAPQSAAVFSVSQAHSDLGLVCLWIDEDMGEPIGFVQGPPSQVEQRFANYEIIALGDDWSLVSSL